MFFVESGTFEWLMGLFDLDLDMSCTIMLEFFEGVAR
jgi:hypothetical protein